MRDFLHHLFLPRESNNHRAHVLHAKSLLLLLSILSTIIIVTPRVEQRYPDILGITANMSVDELVFLTNQKRAESGLPPLILDPQLTQAAQQKAEDMLSKNYWAHVSPDGVTPWYFIKGAGYEYLYAGENLARGFTTAGDTVNAWMASQGHRDNILSANYKDIGFAIVTGTLTGDETVLVVEMFGSRSSAPVAVGSANNQIALVSPTSIPQVVVPTVFPSATLAPAPTVIAQITTFPQTPVEPELRPSEPLGTPQQPFFVASVKKEPFINKPAWFKTTSMIIILLFIGTLVLDIIIIGRKNIVRLISHNIDHIVFLGIIFLAILLLTNGVVL